MALVVGICLDSTIFKSSDPGWGPLSPRQRYKVTDEDPQVIRESCFPKLPPQCQLLTDEASLFGRDVILTASICVVSGFIEVSLTNLDGAVVLESKFALQSRLDQLVHKIGEWHRPSSSIGVLIDLLIDDGSRVNSSEQIEKYTSLTIKINESDRFARSWIQRRARVNGVKLPNIFVGVLLPLSLINGGLKAQMDALGYLGSLLGYLDSLNTRSDCVARDTYERRLWEATVQALRDKVTAEGEACGLAAVLEQLEHPDGYVRNAVFEALTKVVKIGDERAITAVCSHLPHCPCQAFECLLEISEKGDKRLIAAFGNVLDTYGPYSMWSYDLSKYGRWKKAVPRLADKDDERLIKVISKRLEHHTTEVCSAAILALEQAVSKGNEIAVCAMCSRLKDSRMGVRQAALQALSQVANKGDERAIAAARALLKDKSAVVRRAAENALRMLEDPSAVVLDSKNAAVDATLMRTAKAARHQ